MIQPKLSNLQKRDRVRAMYQDEGKSIRQIAAELGVTFQAVQSLLARMGVPRRPRGGNTGSHSRHRA
jgi:transposase